MVQPFGNQFLARPAFADHKNRTIERRGTARPFDRIEKGKALPYELICPLHAPTVGAKSHGLARCFMRINAAFPPDFTVFREDRKSGTALV